MALKMFFQRELHGFNQTVFWQLAGCSSVNLFGNVTICKIAVLRLTSAFPLKINVCSF